MNKTLILSVLLSLSNIYTSGTPTYKKEFKTILEHQQRPTYTQIKEQNISLKIEGQYLPLTQVTFLGTESDLIGKKRIFETHGVWQKGLHISTSKHPLLIWKNISLLDNDSKKMDIIVDGKLINNTNQISFFVYDSKTKANLLASDSIYRERISQKIKALLATNDPSDKRFEKKFWKEFYYVDIYEG